MPCSSRGQSQSGQRGGSSYTSTVRSQYGQSPSRIAGGCSISFGIGIALGGSGPFLHRQYHAYLESGRRRWDRRTLAAGSTAQDVQRLSPEEGSLRGVTPGGSRRLPSPCGCGACRARRRCGPVRAASSSPTCCRSIAWSCTLGPRNSDRTGTACWPSGATGPTGPGNSPPPSRSRPFVALTGGRIERPPSSRHSNDAWDRFIPHRSLIRARHAAQTSGSKMLLVASEPW
jgi:hypothetical protein